MNTKKRNDQLISLAFRAMNEADIFTEGNSINSSYNRQIAAFCVSIAMGGLKPTIAFYSNTSSSASVDRLKIIRLKIISIIGSMVSNDPAFKVKEGENFIGLDAIKSTIFNAGDERLPALRKEILDCSIALKQVVRTYNLID